MRESALRFWDRVALATIASMSLLPLLPAALP
jgi:hypothetical protein